MSLHKKLKIDNEENGQITTKNYDENISQLFYKAFRNIFIKKQLFKFIRLLNNLHRLISNQQYSNFYNYHFHYNDFINNFNLFNNVINSNNNNNNNNNNNSNINNNNNNNYNNINNNYNNINNNNYNNENNNNYNNINNNKIEKEYLPSNIKNLNLSLNDEPNIISIPDSVETLTFGCKFIGTLSSSYLPKGLKTLIFNLGCSSEFNSNSFNNLSTTSSSIEKLVLSGRFNYPIPINCLVGNSLKEIQFIGKYNQPILSNSIPNSVTSLVFGDYFNKAIYGLPDSIVHIQFGKSFNQELTKDWIPNNLKSLELGTNFNKIIKPNVLPITLEKLEFKDHNLLSTTFFSSNNNNNIDYKQNSPTKNINNNIKNLNSSGSLLDYCFTSSPFEKLLVQGSIPNSNCWVIIDGLAIQGPQLDISKSSENYYKEEDELYFNYREIKPNMIPMGVKRIIFHDNFDSLIRKNVIPNSVEEIELGNKFNKPLVINSFSSSLTSIIFGDSFDQCLRVGCLPNSCTSLTLGLCFNQRIEPNQLPQGLKILKLSYRFDYQLEVGSLPQSLEYLQFGYLFNQTIGHNVLPKSLKSLVLGWNFNKPIEVGVLPNSLIKLEFGYHYNQDLPINCIPSSIEVLKLRNCPKQLLVSNHDFILPSSIKKLEFNTSPLFYPFNIPPNITSFKYLGSLRDLPKRNSSNNNQFDIVSSSSNISNSNGSGGGGCNLKKLSFSPNFNEPININELPSSIETLIMSHKYNQPLSPNCLPKKLKVLIFGYYFNEKLTKNVLPNNLGYIEFGEKFDQVLESDSLPKSLKYITFDKSYKQPIGSNVLPPSLELIIIKNWNNLPFNFEIFDHDSILQQIKIITISNNNTKKFWKYIKNKI
ncbi:hypothetical protein ACTFIU_011481 [Dictyostelium citrinum]